MTPRDRILSPTCLSHWMGLVVLVSSEYDCHSAAMLTACEAFIYVNNTLGHCYSLLSILQGNVQIFANENCTQSSAEAEGISIFCRFADFAGIRWETKALGKWRWKSPKLLQCQLCSDLTDQHSQENVSSGDHVCLYNPSCNLNILVRIRAADWPKDWPTEKQKKGNILSQASSQYLLFSQYKL